MADPTLVQSVSLVRWKKHQASTSVNLYEQMCTEKFTDCSISVENKIIACHRNILSSISPLFERILSHFANSKPVIVFVDATITADDIKNVLKFAYTGECIIASASIKHFLEVGKRLEINGLNDTSNEMDDTNSHDPGSASLHLPQMSQSTEALTNAKNIVSDFKVPALPQNQETTLIKTKDRRASQDIKNVTTATQIDKQQKKPRRKTIYESRVGEASRRRKQDPPEDCQENKKPKLDKKDLPFVCNFCPKHYASKFTLNTHQRECESNPNKRIVECNICNEIMKPSSLSRHRNRHARKSTF